jgi:hypothetical protein
MLRENADVANFIIIVSKNDAVMDTHVVRHHSSEDVRFLSCHGA